MQWDPTPEDLERIAKRKIIQGHHINCRHYRPLFGLVDCAKHSIREDCYECKTCPQCGGRMVLKTERKLDRKVQMLKVETRTCIECSLYIEDHAERIRYKATDTEPGGDETTPPRCEVELCNHRTWETRKRTVDGKDWNICDHHDRQLRTFHRHPGKDPAQQPLIVSEGKLIENPLYKRAALAKGR